MSVETLLLFIPACFALNLAPGPNKLLSVSNATHYGFWADSVAGVGWLLAFVGMIAIAAAAGISSFFNREAEHVPCDSLPPSGWAGSLED